MIKQLKWLLFILLTLNSQLVNSQETFHFTQGLFIPGIHHYGREAIYTDSLAFQLYNQTLEKPSLGNMFWTGTNQSSKSWRQINANYHLYYL